MTMVIAVLRTAFATTRKKLAGGFWRLLPACFNHVEGAPANQTSVGPQIVAFGAGGDSVENHARIAFLAGRIWMGDLRCHERMLMQIYIGVSSVELRHTHEWSQ